MPAGMLVSPGGILPSEHGQLRSRPFCLHHGPSVERYSITYLCFYGLALAISFFQPLCAQALDEISNSVDSCAGILHLMMSYRMVERTSDSCACSGARCPRLCSSHSQSSCSPALRLPSSDAAWGVRLCSVLRPYVRPTFTVGRSCMHCAIRRQSTAWRHWRSRQLTLFVVYLLYKWNYMCKVFFWLLAGFETYVR